MEADRARESRESLLSEGTAVSRDSFISMSNKLLSLESELDKTLRDLDIPSVPVGKPGHTHSKSPSSRRSRLSPASRRRSGSIDPLANSRRSSSIDLRSVEPEQRALTERVDVLEKEQIVRFFLSTFLSAHH